ncbi:MAG: FtsW/RodA/SpoVE family cell cycle protein [Candidatus Villigracilaceae bacterium]
MLRGLSWRHFDFWLLGALSALVIFGVAMIRSAVAGNIELTTITPLVSRQIVFAGIGFVAMIVMASIDYHFWSAVNRTLYFIMFLVLFLLNVVGRALFGSARWFQTALINIQPSEFAKIVLILVLAFYFSRHFDEMEKPRHILLSFLLTMGLTTWIVLQPNLSTSIVMLVLWFALLWIAGVKVKHLLLFGGIGLLILAINLPILIETKVIEQYQINRVRTFFFPDPNARYGDKYNIDQALISIGSGGWAGFGYGQGPQVQLRFLKVRWSDFIFAAIGHEFGFVGAVLVVSLILFIVLRCLRAAQLAQEPFGAFIAYGVAVLIAFQATVNIGVNLNLMPATGLTLPFVSYGGSSLVSNMLAVGLVESVIMRRNPIEF